jgi:oligopeptide/dipeptide ABC transporter ATP-binding protein
VDFTIQRGDILTLVGESGCGKTTVAKLIMQLLRPTSGKVFFNGTEIFEAKGRASQAIRSKTQMIFQDPYGSLDPHLIIFSNVVEALESNRLFSGTSKTERRKLVARALDDVGLKPGEDFFDKYPSELSGGQLQRVSIARAIVSNPEFIVADEPTSMLDVSVRAKILSLLLELRKKYDLTYLIITHDLAMARYISNEIAIMYLGKIVELGHSEELVSNPLHPYTQALLNAVPTVDDDNDTKGEKGVAATISREVPNAIDIPAGCRFNTRCPYAMDNCFTKEPELVQIKKGHYAACHLLVKESFS